jgi:hypothetical protein
MDLGEEARLNGRTGYVVWSAKDAPAHGLGKKFLVSQAHSVLILCSFMTGMKSQTSLC